MSGPKYYVSAFNSSLRQIFLLQSKLRLELDELPKLSVTDKDRDIQFDCSEPLEGFESRAEDPLQSLQISQTGELSRETYNSFKRLISKRTKLLNELLKQIATAKNDFHEKKADYDAFLTHEQTFEGCHRHLGDLCRQVIHYLETYSDAQQLQTALSAIENIALTTPMAEFRFGFRDLEAGLSSDIKTELSDCILNINNIRVEVSNAILEEARRDGASDTKLDLIQDEIPESKDASLILKLVSKIEARMSEVDDEQIKSGYSKRLKYLSDAQHKKSSYFFKELLDEINEGEKTRWLKIRVAKEIAILDTITLDPTLRDDGLSARSLAASLLQADSVKDQDLDNLRAKTKSVVHLNELALEARLAGEKERRFLKEQIIQSLNRLNYEVVDDATVIDFEHESDFFLSIPGQPNYLNLRFQDDGSFLYNFLIQEDKDSLSVDQREARLREMGSACTEFQEVLEKLEGAGLHVSRKSAMPVSEEALTQVPKKHRHKVAAKKKRKKASQVAKEKYLKK